MKVKISKKNSKLKNVWNLSLPPIGTCIPGAPCAKLCYAMNAYRMYPGTRNAWNHNIIFWRKDPGGYEASIAMQLRNVKKPIGLFRWHVGGDIPSLRYFYMMCHIAEDFPDIKFLAFTKRYNYIDSAIRIPKNFSMVLSAWPGLDMHNPLKLPIAWMQDGSETRVPVNALECHGGCESCGLCWELNKLSRDVVFNQH